MIAMAVANRVARDQAQQTLKDLTIRSSASPGGSADCSSPAPRLVYAITRRSVSEGQMIKEGEAVFELVIENPLRLWTNVPERYTDGPASRPAGAGLGGLASRDDLRGQGGADQPVGRLGQPDVPGRDPGPQRRGPAAPGGFAKATIVTDASAEAAVVPIESIVQFAGVTKLFVVEERQGPRGRRRRHRRGGHGLGRGLEQALPKPGGRHHRPDPARRRHRRLSIRTRPRPTPTPATPKPSSPLDQARLKTADNRRSRTSAVVSRDRTLPRTHARRSAAVTDSTSGSPMTISDICIKRPVFTWVLVAIPVVLGMVSYSELGVDLFPDVDFPVCTVTTVLPGASVEEMETTVTKPIEDIINTVSGIDELRSTTQEGVSVVTVQFLLSKNGDVGTQEVRDKVNTILADLPDGTEPPIIDKFDTGLDARHDDRRLGPARLPRGDRDRPQADQGAAGDGQRRRRGHPRRRPGRGR